MSDTSVAPDTTAEGSDGNVDIKALRQQAEEAKRLRAEADAAKRENLFLRAGVDVDSKVGQLLFKTWDGEDPEALRAEWAELTGATNQQPATNPGDNPELASQQEHRQQLTGQPTGATPPAERNPFDLMYEKFQQGLSEGQTLEERQDEAIGFILQQFAKGNPAVMFDSAAWREKQTLYGGE